MDRGGATDDAIDQLTGGRTGVGPSETSGSADDLAVLLGKLHCFARGSRGRQTDSDGDFFGILRQWLRQDEVRISNNGGVNQLHTDTTPSKVNLNR